MNNDMIIQTLINYGLAGIVIFIFYKLITNELKELKESIDKLNDNLIKLIEKMRD